MDKRIYIAAVIGIAVLLLQMAASSLFDLYEKDVSVRQNEHGTIMGAIYMTLNNPFYKVIDDEMRTQIENHGDILLSRNPSLSEERQEEEIQDLVNAGIKVLFVNPVDAVNISHALERAKAAGVHIVAIDTNVARQDLVDSTVVSDNYNAGVQCAEHLLANRDSGRIALLTHDKTTSGRDRIRGFLDTIKRNDAFEVVDSADCQGQLELAMPAMEEMLNRHPDIDVVMALNDPSALGGIAALQRAGKLGNTMIYGVDGTSEAKDMIENGLMTASAAQEPKRIARLAVEEAYNILEGRSIHNMISIPTILITKGSALPTWAR